MRRLLLIAALALLPVASFAQAPIAARTTPPTDPRLAQPTIDALSALLKLRQAELKAEMADHTKRAAALAAYWRRYVDGLKPAVASAPKPHLK